ncbi:hypothetical protein [Sphingobium sp.]|uniref:hypothetical protein n=1 Tax=Sphingobium sp. TaxID=1912891 RepID=UPI003B3A92D3
MAEIADILNEGAAMAAFMALDGHGAAIGCVEATLRQDDVNGCDTGPVLLIEGIMSAPTSAARVSRDA